LVTGDAGPPKADVDALGEFDPAVGWDWPNGFGGAEVLVPNAEGPLLANALKPPPVEFSGLVVVDAPNAELPNGCAVADEPNGCAVVEDPNGCAVPKALAAAGSG
jgi:hypothetical protein